MCICVCGKNELPRLAFHFKIRRAGRMPVDASACVNLLVLICFPIHVQHLLAASTSLYLKYIGFGQTGRAKAKLDDLVNK